MILVNKCIANGFTTEMKQQEYIAKVFTIKSIGNSDCYCQWYKTSITEMYNGIGVIKVDVKNTFKCILKLLFKL